MSSEKTPIASEAITPRSRIRRSGCVPHSAFTDPRLVGLSVEARFLLVTAHAYAVRDESQQVEGAAVPSVGWLPLHAVDFLSDRMQTTSNDATHALVDLVEVGLLVWSDEGLLGVPGWESESAPRVRNLRAKRAAQQAAEALDFHPFERKAAAAVAEVRRPNAAARKAAGPKSLGGSDSAIAERDNRRPMGRT